MLVAARITPKKRKNYYRFINISILLLLVVSCSRHGDVLAEYEGGYVTNTDFLNNYRNFLKVTGIRDNMSSRRMILENVINENLLLVELSINQFSNSDIYQYEKDLIYQQMLLNYFYRDELLSCVTFSDRKIRQIHILENTLYHIKQIFAQDFDLAMEYYLALESGKSFEQLVTPDVNVTYEYANTDLGYVSLSDLHPRFRKRITMLSVGEISQPIKGRYGYTVVKVVDKTRPLFLTEYEFSKQKPRLEAKLRNIYSDSLVNAYTRDLVAQTEFSWEKANLRWLLDFLQNIKSKEDFNIYSESISLSDRVIYQTDGNDVELTALLPIIRKSKFDHLKAVHDIETLKDFIAGSVVREEIITRAKDKRLDKSERFQNEFKIKTEKLKMELWNQLLSDTVHFTEPDYEHFYQNYPDLFVIPVKRMVYEIRNKDQKVISEVKMRVLQGDSFQHLAEIFSDHRDPKHPRGLLGILSSQELGKLGTTIFSAPLNDVIGPLEYDGYYYLFISTEEYPSRKLSLSEAKPLINTWFREELNTKRKMKYFEQLTEQYCVKRNYEALKNIKYVDMKEKT